MKNAEKQLLKAVKVAAKKQTDDPSKIPGCPTIFHQPKRPKK